MIRCLALLLTFALAARAEVKLHNLFTDDMVLQQKAPVTIWGWADADEEVTVEFRGQKVKAKNKDGKWQAKLKSLKAGGPDQLTIKAARKGQPQQTAATLSRVLVGEVWIASGQSNMEWPMRASFDADTEISKARNPQLRLYTVPKLKAESPRENIDGRWVECTPETTPGFSAVAYYFARDLQKALGVPVGIIHTSWGGSPAEVWMSRDVLAKNADYKRDILDASETAFAKYQQSLAAFKQEQEAAKKEGKEFKKQAPRAPWRATELYNGMIAPLIPFTIKGAIWYQGESNAGRAWEYRQLFQDMITNWRRDWDLGNFPFLLVQLAPFKAIKPEPAESDWAELREAQALAAKELPKVGMAIITDVGDEKDIHPKKKEPVGARLALAARAIAYNEDIVYSGPTYKSMKVKANEAVLSFEHVGSGLEARGDQLKGFAIAGDDRKFVWGKARIDGDKVVVSHPNIARPAAVRFGWADYPVVDFWNKDGLPASPFRTDDFPMITAPKKQ
jgi:sialate O-acetylesterase